MEGPTCRRRPQRLSRLPDRASGLADGRRLRRPSAVLSHLRGRSWGWGSRQPLACADQTFLGGTAVLATARTPPITCVCTNRQFLARRGLRKWGLGQNPGVGTPPTTYVCANLPLLGGTAVLTTARTPPTTCICTNLHCLTRGGLRKWGLGQNPGVGSPPTTYVCTDLPFLGGTAPRLTAPTGPPACAFRTRSRPSDLPQSRPRRCADDRRARRRSSR